MMTNHNNYPRTFNLITAINKTVCTAHFAIPYRYDSGLYTVSL